MHYFMHTFNFPPHHAIDMGMAYMVTGVDRAIATRRGKMGDAAGLGVIPPCSHSGWHANKNL